jgi:FkbM family methyltransferase
MVKEKVKKLTQGSILYGPLRDTYRFVFNRSSRQHHKRAESFYRQFVSKGALVFDIGANNGEYTEMFLNLGARVVAVEPNPDLIPLLRRIRPSRRLSVECAALGNRNGEAELFICDQDGLSTLSRNRKNFVESQPRYAGRNWDRTVRVPLSTVDAMISKYGKPDFIKIDVEGFECEVLSGLSVLPKYLSFEFQNDSLELTTACIRRECFSPRARFNLIVGNPFARNPRPLEFMLREWVSADSIITLLQPGSVTSAANYGEIFVREGP